MKTRTCPSCDLPAPRHCPNEACSWWHCRRCDLRITPTRSVRIERATTNTNPGEHRG